MDEEEQILQQLSSSAYYREESGKLLKEYHACSTMHAQSLMRGKLEAMLGKMQFQIRELRKYINENI